MTLLELREKLASRIKYEEDTVLQMIESNSFETHPSLYAIHTTRLETLLDMLEDLQSIVESTNVSTDRETPEQYAEREMRRMMLENEHVPDHSNSSYYPEEI
jgi:hypothetical protein